MGLENLKVQISKARPGALLLPSPQRLPKSWFLSTAKFQAGFQCPRQESGSKLLLRPGRRCNTHRHNPLSRIRRNPACPAALLMQITGNQVDKIALCFPFHPFIIAFFIANYYFEHATEIGWEILFCNDRLVALGNKS